MYMPLLRRTHIAIIKMFEKLFVLLLLSQVPYIYFMYAQYNSHSQDYTDNSILYFIISLIPIIYMHPSNIYACKIWGKR